MPSSTRSVSERTNDIELVKENRIRSAGVSFTDARSVLDNAGSPESGCFYLYRFQLAGLLNLFDCEQRLVGQLLGELLDRLVPSDPSPVSKEDCAWLGDLARRGNRYAFELRGDAGLRREPLARIKFSLPVGRLESLELFLRPGWASCDRYGCSGAKYYLMELVSDFVVPTVAEPASIFDPARVVEEWSWRRRRAVNDAMQGYAECGSSDSANGAWLQEPILN